MPRLRRMQVGVAREVTSGEYRVALTPALAHGVNVAGGEVVLPEVARAHGRTAVPLAEVLS